MARPPCPADRANRQSRISRVGRVGPETPPIDTPAPSPSSTRRLYTTGIGRRLPDQATLVAAAAPLRRPPSRPVNRRICRRPCPRPATAMRHPGAARGHCCAASPFRHAKSLFMPVFPVRQPRRRSPALQDHGWPAGHVAAARARKVGERDSAKRAAHDNVARCLQPLLPQSGSAFQAEMMRSREPSVWIRSTEYQ